MTYKGIIENDIIYGRGAQDDKGPTIAALFAVKALMKDGYKFNKKFVSFLELMKKSYGAELKNTMKRNLKST